MARRLFARLVAIAAIAGTLVLTGCASAPQGQVVTNPNFDGVYRLAYSASGGALYYRFFADGSVLSARSEAPVSDVLATLTLENANTSRGTWTASNGELKVGIDEGSVSYDSRFDIRDNGRIALRGLPRNFEFLHAGEGGSAEVSSR